jgi:acyl carrier protein
VQQFLSVQLAAALRTQPEKIDVHIPLGDFGMDSFVAVDLRNRIESSFGLTLSATMVWNYPTVHAIAEYLVELLGQGHGAAEPTEDADLAALLQAAVVASEDELRAAQNGGGP